MPEWIYANQAQGDWLLRDRGADILCPDPGLVGEPYDWDRSCFLIFSQGCWG